jgi:hypothetical protein
MNDGFGKTLKSQKGRVSRVVLEPTTTALIGHDSELSRARLNKRVEGNKAA